MLNKIIKFSLDHKLFILLAAILLIVAGLWSANRTDIDVFPDLTAPQVVVMTDAVGMAPEEVERLVTFPIETAVNGATNVRRVRSTSLQGCSFVFVEFDWGMDVFRARQIVSEKLTTLTEQLPEGITPVLAPQSSVMGEILFVSLQLDTAATNPVTSMMELRTLAECNKTAPADVNNFVKDRVEKFVGDEPLQDDIAMLTLHYNGPAAQA